MLEGLRIGRICKALVGALPPSGKTLVLAESCTGGIIAAAITAVPGSSALLWGSLVVYSNEAKAALAGVDPRIISAHGAVSGECVAALLEGALSRSGAGIALAVSGVAGPGGGSPEKPVGSVWIGAAARSGERELRLFRFPGGRRKVRLQAALEGLRMVARIAGIPAGKGKAQA